MLCCCQVRSNEVSVTLFAALFYCLIFVSPTFIHLSFQPSIAGFKNIDFENLGYVEKFRVPTSTLTPPSLETILQRMLCPIRHHNTD